MITRSRILSILSTCLVFTTLTFAQGTRRWEQSKSEDFEKGVADGVAIRSDGGLELAPAFKSVITIPSPYVWAIAPDRNGNLFAATGTPGRVLRITPGGESSVIFESQELQVQALSVDDDDVVYAATNPDGKIYRLTLSSTADSHKAGEKKGRTSEPDSNWTSSVFFDPGTKYIWDLAIDRSGNLFVATGDHGEIFRITRNGEHSLFFKSDEAQIRALRFDHQGNLIAGSDGSGLVYRILPNGEGFVLYSASKKEITALAIDANGNIYAAAAGEKRGSSAELSSLSLSASSTASIQSGPGTSAGLSTGRATSSSPQLLGNPMGSGSNPSGGSEIYRISSEGVPSRIWSSRNDLVYALVLDSNGRLLAGTGNRGRIFEITGDDQFTDLLAASATQVTAFAPAPKSGLYASSSNLGKIFRLGASANSEGTYVSDVFDAHIFSRWGRIEFRGSGNVELFARSGNVDNPDRNWSPWKKVEWQKDAEVAAPSARFIQWKAVLYSGNTAPRVQSVTINYLSKNVAPTFEDVAVQEGVRYQPAASSSKDSGGSGPPNSQHFDSPPTPIQDRDSIGITWSVHDDNDDDMVYSIYYRGEGETRWLLLKDSLRDKFYSFDSSLLPDGAYTVKVVASDAPSHSPSQGLSAERESSRFEMDTTPPRIEDLQASIEGKQIHVRFQAVDSFSAIQKAEYSVDAGDWQLVEPLGQISDSKTENYDFRADVQPIGSVGSGDPDHSKVMAAEHVVVVRAYDRHDNMASSKVVVAGK